MKKVLATVAGGYPRIGDTTEKQRLRKAIDKWERKQISDSDLIKVEESVTEEVIKEQIDAGIDIPSDGQIRWYDNVSHFMRSMARINGLLRFYDTNYLFRQPVVNRKLERKSPILLEEFKFAQSKTKKPVKVVLTGPYTTSMLSLDEFYKSKEKLVM
jgi:5-methyltetrahydropteroyltriglutamate--homocysteine methyltransferase